MNRISDWQRGAIPKDLIFDGTSENFTFDFDSDLI